MIDAVASGLLRAFPTLPHSHLTQLLIATQRLGQSAEPIQRLAASLLAARGEGSDLLWGEAQACGGFAGA